jgi:hypothetical protein
MSKFFLLASCFNLLTSGTHLYGNWVEELVDLGKEDAVLADLPEEKALYESINDIYHPTIAEYQKIEDFLHNGPRPYLRWLNIFNEPNYKETCRYDLRARNIRIVGPYRSDYDLQKVVYKTDENDKEFCIVTYASISDDNQRRAQIERLKKKLTKVGFVGHLLYRNGGWPDVEGGSLKLIHVPYAFKVCMIKEARSLGYKKILWLDTSIVPMNDLTKIKKSIDNSGYFFTHLKGLNLYRYTSKSLTDYYDLSEDDNKINIKPIAGGMVGINFDTEAGRYLFDAWYDSAIALDPWLTSRPDQNVLAVLAFLMDLEPTDTLSNVAFEKWRDYRFKHSFYIDRIKLKK